jgi:ABC-2 type transport system permease protein
VAPGPLGEELVASLRRGDVVDVVRLGVDEEIEDAVERGRVHAGLVVPRGYDAALRSGKTVTLRYFARLDSAAQELSMTVDSAVAEQARVLRAARFLVAERGTQVDEALDAAEAAAAGAAPVRARVVTAGQEPVPATGGRFDIGARNQLLLFVFVTSLTAAAALIRTRRLGLSRRMLATPTSTRAVIAGEALGRYGIALVQALLIMAGSFLAFGVEWGDPLGALLLVLAFCLVGSGAAMLLGSALSSPEQAEPVALLVGLGFAAFRRRHGAARGLPRRGPRPRARHAARVGERRLRRSPARPGRERRAR